MQRIIKYNEFFDTEDLRNSNEIEFLSNKLSKLKIIQSFDTESPFLSVFRSLTYKYAFFNEAKKLNDYANIGETGRKPKTYFINFKNEQAKVMLGITIIFGKRYDLDIIYIPSGVDEQSNDWVTTNDSILLDIYRNVCVNQTFKHVTMDDIYKKIDKVLIPIYKEFGFSTLLNLNKSNYDINKN